jgi:hypothetical protein
MMEQSAMTFTVSRIVLPLTLLITTLALALGLAAVSAQAQTASRAWVSGHGTDQAGCGAVPTPCRTPQYAHDHIIAAGGEIDILDPAGYGAITITKAISIVNDGVGTAGMLAPAAGNAITINAGASDAIQLRGLTIEGSGVGYNGIVFNSGGSLTVSKCTLQNFVQNGSDQTTGNGVLMQPTTGTLAFTITNTTASNNGDVGIFFFPPSGSPNANGVIDHVVADANLGGIWIEPILATGGSIVVTVSNSIASNNSNTGILADPGSAALKVSIDNVTISGNVEGIEADTPANVLLGRSVITGNTVGVKNLTSPNTFGSYQDNRINLNGASGDINGAMNPLGPQ